MLGYITWTIKLIFKCVFFLVCLFLLFFQDFINVQDQSVFQFFVFFCSLILKKVKQIILCEKSKMVHSFVDERSFNPSLLHTQRHTNLTSWFYAAQTQKQNTPVLLRAQTHTHRLQSWSSDGGIYG